MKLAIGIVAAVLFVFAHTAKQPTLQECLQVCTGSLLSRLYGDCSAEELGYPDVPTYYDDYVGCNLGCYGTARSKPGKDGSQGLLGIDPPE